MSIHPRKKKTIPKSGKNIIIIIIIMNTTTWSYVYIEIYTLLYIVDRPS